MPLPGRRSCRGALKLLAAVLMVFPCALLAEDIARPKLVVPQTVFDFGMVVQGAKVKHDFIVRNQGQADLAIQRVVAACGCTATTASQGTVPPGGEATVTVEFDTAGFSGDKVKTIRLYTNDFDNPSMLLSMKGSIQPDVSISPKSLVFEDVVRGNSPGQEKEVTVEARSGSDVQIEGVRSFSRFVNVREIRGDQRSRKVAVSIHPEVSVGELRDRLVVSFKKGKEESAINIPVRAIVSGRLKLEPATLSFGVLEGTQPIVRQTRLENRGDGKVAIKALQSSDPAVKAHFKSIQDGRRYVIHVEIDPSLVKEDLRAALEVLTDSPDEPALTLNIYGILPPRM